jgi:hypothetical protein
MTAGARVATFEQRLVTVEEKQTRSDVRHDEFSQQVLEQLRRIEINVAELRAEQRILHRR